MWYTVSYVLVNETILTCVDDCFGQSNFVGFVVANTTIATISSILSSSSLVIFCQLPPQAAIHVHEKRASNLMICRQKVLQPCTILTRPLQCATTLPRHDTQAIGIPKLYYPPPRPHRPQPPIPPPRTTTIAKSVSCPGDGTVVRSKDNTYVKHVVKLRTNKSYRAELGTVLLVGTTLIVEVLAACSREAPLNIKVLFCLEDEPLPG